MASSAARQRPASRRPAFAGAAAVSAERIAISLIAASDCSMTGAAAADRVPIAQSAQIATSDTTGARATGPGVRLGRGTD